MFEPSPDGCSWTHGSLQVHFSRGTTTQSRILSTGECPSVEEKKGIKQSNRGGKWRWFKAKRTGLVCFLLAIFHPPGSIISCGMHAGDGRPAVKKKGFSFLVKVSCDTNKITLHLWLLSEVTSVSGEQAVLFSWSNITLKRACLNLSLMWVMTVNMSG